MTLRLGLLIGFGAGYYLGARAGRERYQQLNEMIGKVKSSSAYDNATDKAQAVVDVAADRAKDAASSAASAAKDKIQSNKNDTEVNLNAKDQTDAVNPS